MIKPYFIPLAVLLAPLAAAAEPQPIATPPEEQLRIFTEMAEKTQFSVYDTKVIAGLGWDIGRKPDQPTFEPSFERTYEATAAALSTDPDGVMLARAFRESHPENLKAAGRALREAGWM